MSVDNVRVHLEQGGITVPSVDETLPFAPCYLLPPITALLLTPLRVADGSIPLPFLPSESVLLHLLLGRRVPASGEVTLLLFLGDEKDDQGVEPPHLCPCARYSMVVHRTWVYDESAWSTIKDGTPCSEKGGQTGGKAAPDPPVGLVTPGTRVLVQGQTCDWLAPDREVWESFLGPGVGLLPSDPPVLSEMCVRIKLGLGLGPRVGGGLAQAREQAPGLVLLDGPSGSGKTALVRAAALALGLVTVLVRPGGLMARHDVEADQALERAAAAAAAMGPALLLLDNVDLLVPGVGSRVIGASRGEVDGSLARWVARVGEREGWEGSPGWSSPCGGTPGRVMVVMTARSGWCPGLFGVDCRLSLSPGSESRGCQASLLAQCWEQGGGRAGQGDLEAFHAGRDPARLEPAYTPSEADWVAVARLCQGFSLGSIAAMARRAKRRLASPAPGSDRGEAEEPGESWRAAFTQAVAESRAQQLARGTGMTAVLRVEPPVTWAEVGGQAAAKEAVREMIVWPMARPKAFARLGIDPPAGLLLYGPPGTGKTLIAKAAACQCGAGFMWLRITDVVRGEVGTGEKLVREAFRVAQENRPVVIFIDEFQALFSAREGGGGGGRLASQLLLSMDALRREHGREGEVGEDAAGFVSVLAATNAPEAIDSAFLRPGRFDRLVYVGLPDQQDRADILDRWRERMRWAEDMGVAELAEQTEGFSGADLANLMRRAALHALAAHKSPPWPDGGGRDGRASQGGSNEAAVPLPLIRREDVQAALRTCRATTSPESLSKFEAYCRLHGGSGE